jgi:quercetin dioxygenase-like cupin family protein
MAEVIDLAAPQGEGPLWGTATEDLNATLLAWPAGHEVAEHVNDERDVLIVVVAGSATVMVDGAAHEMAADQAIVIEKGRSRAIRAGGDGVRYVSVHRRRGPLQLEAVESRTR